MRLAPPRDPHARYLPFVVVAVLAQLSALWPPGPDDLGAFWASTALLVVATVMIVWRPRWPGGTWLVMSAIYVVSVSLLIVSTGGTASGLGALLFVPVVGVALYGEVWESYAVIVLDLGAIMGISAVAGSHVAAADPRRLFFFTCVAVFLSVAIQALRRRVIESNERTKRLLRGAEAANEAARRLATLSEPATIAAIGVELAVTVVFPPEAELRRAAYYRVVDRCFEVLEVHEEGGERGPAVPSMPPDRLIDMGWLLQEHPPLRQAVLTGQPLSARLDPERLGPVLRATLEETGVSHGAWVPVRPEGKLHGVLAVADRRPVATESLDRLVALGHLMELALANWGAHEELAQQATLEERRRIARELHDGLAHELAFIASKTRGAWADGPVGSLDVRAVAGAADRALDEARRAITVLSVARPQSVADAIAQTAEDMSERYAMGVELDLDEGVTLPGDVTESLLRIVREALTNASVHGQAGHVRVLLHDPGRLRLVVEDDGCGFDPTAARSGGGFGLLSMEERAVSVGAELQVDSAAGRGTRVTVEFP